MAGKVRVSKPNSTDFDTTEFTPAPFHLEGRLRFEQGAEQVFAVVADHEKLDRWVPLVKDLSVTYPQLQPPHQNGVGVKRAMRLPGLGHFTEEVVYWRAPTCYAYRAYGKRFPMRDYLGVFLVETIADRRGLVIWRLYFNLHGYLKSHTFPAVLAMSVKHILGKLSKFIGGTEISISSGSNLMLSSEDAKYF